jgi:hypothetical protein
MFNIVLYGNFFKNYSFKPLNYLKVNLAAMILRWLSTKCKIFCVDQKFKMAITTCMTLFNIEPYGDMNII